MKSYSFDFLCNIGGVFMSKNHHCNNDDLCSEFAEILGAEILTSTK